uniref:response regulator n=1 Tax=Paractinoplanes polyasparticus TaxID=2856853 RepID=UPI001C859EED|nr:response regulator [Actinoplanes polyasparticus]
MATVLVVDDQAVSRRLTRDLLGYRGHRVIEAPDAEHALHLAHAEHPDLVLTDVLMPGVDGYQLAQKLRSADDTARIPIVFLTANYLPEEAQPFADACGIDKVILKSAEPHELLQSVDDVLRTGHDPTATLDPGRAQAAHLRAVTDKLAETNQTLADTEERFRVIAEQAPIGIAYGDEHGAAHYINARFAAIMGMHPDDLLGREWIRCTTADLHSELLAVISGKMPQHQLRHRGQSQRPDGTTVWLDVQLQPLQQDSDTRGFICIADDVTAITQAEQARRDAERQHEAEEHARTTERIQSLSNLAGGVAHDFNNILGAILGYETLLTETISDLAAAGTLDEQTTAELLGDLRNIRTGGERATGLTQQLLTFGSRRLMNPTPLDLNAAIRETTQLLHTTLGPNIRVITQLDPGLRPVQAEPANMSQVLLNLTLNARDAMPDGGTLTVTTRNVDTGETGDSPDLPPGKYARLSVSDTGHGMTPDVLQRAVEPFYTTKPRGQGTGLGLATVYGIINQLGGLLHLTSSPQQGTTAVIHLPTTDTPTQTPTQPAPTAGGGAETVLVVDDEDGVRDITARILTKAGYHVLTASSGPQAIDTVEKHHAPIDLVLTDVVMPGMLGTELCTHLLSHRPGTKALLMSGYAGDIITDNGSLNTHLPLLAKPFTEADLLNTVRTTLNTPAI